MQPKLEAKELITSRPGVIGDKNFILATWLRGMYYGDSWFKEMPKDLFMKHYHEIISNIIKIPGLQVKVACLKEDSDIILGYVIYKGPVLYWAFTKSAWRHIGIAKSLVPEGITTVNHLTRVGLSIMKKNPQVHFNPFAIG